MANEPGKTLETVKGASRAKFGPVTLSRPRAVGIFEGKRGGRSTIAIACSVPLMGSGLIIDAAIWARLEAKSDGHEITFAASLPKGIGAVDETSEDAFLAHVENAALAWNGYDMATDAAGARLLGLKTPQQTADAKAGVAMRPRLVKTAKELTAGSAPVTAGVETPHPAA